VPICRYEAARSKGDYDDESRRRHNAKASLERYMHYFERFDAHAKAYDKARSEAARTEAEVLEVLSDMTRTPTSQLRFIMDAWRQVCDALQAWR
jgi:ariadne-1